MFQLAFFGEGEGGGGGGKYVINLFLLPNAILFVLHFTLLILGIQIIIFFFSSFNYPNVALRS